MYLKLLSKRKNKKWLYHRIRMCIWKQWKLPRTKKNFDSKKAERYFKERGIKYQFIDMKEKGLSKGEFQSVCKAIGGYNKLIDTDCKDKDLLALITYIAEEDKAEKILENQSIIKVPVVRNGKQATVGYQPEIWKSWK